MPGSTGQVSVQRCLNEPVVDIVGMKSGHISDLLLDRRSGQIDFARVALASGVASDRPHITIPWSALSAPQEGRQWHRSARARRSILENMARREV